MVLKDNVKILCKLRGITQKELAEKIGVADSSLNVTLKRTEIRFLSVQNIARGLGVSIDTLVSDDVEQSFAEEQERNAPTEQPKPEPKQGFFCPHCGRPLMLLVKAENSAGESEHTEQ